MRRIARTVPLPLMASLLLMGAGWRVAAAGAQDSFAAVLTTSAMILLGAWIREFNWAQDLPGENPPDKGS